MAVMNICPNNYYPASWQFLDIIEKQGFMQTSAIWVHQVKNSGQSWMPLSASGVEPGCFDLIVLLKSPLVKAHRDLKSFLQTCL